MKMSDGLFIRCFGKVGKLYPETEMRSMIVDNASMQLVMRPEQFDILLCENLYGDIISDLCAGLIGGLGLVPGANIGERGAVFEAVLFGAGHRRERELPTRRRFYNPPS
jgi:isocitrate dehydrogenase (NAD+)